MVGAVRRCRAPRGARGHRAARGADQRRGVRRLLPRLREPHAVAALSRRHPHAELRAPVVAVVRDGEPPLRRGRGGRGRHRRDRVGARLPPAARTDDAARRSGPTCASASSCTSRSRRRSCSCSSRGAARSSKACSAPTSSGFQVPGARVELLRGSPGASPTRRPPTAGSVHDGRIVRVGAFPISIDAAHLAERAADPAVVERARQIRARPRRPRARAARRRPARLHEGHRPAHPRRRRALRRGRARDAAPRDGADRGAEPRGRHALPARARATSSASSARSTARIRGSAIPRSTTCTRAWSSTSCRALPRGRRDARHAACATA